MSRVVGLKAPTYTCCGIPSLSRIPPLLLYASLYSSCTPLIPLYNTLSLCLPPIVLVTVPLFLDRGTVLRTGENRGKEIGVITLFTQEHRALFLRFAPGIGSLLFYVVGSVDICCGRDGSTLPSLETVASGARDC
jgi:hypothetical protein